MNTNSKLGGKLLFVDTVIICIKNIKYNCIILQLPRGVQISRLLHSL